MTEDEREAILACIRFSDMKFEDRVELRGRFRALLVEVDRLRAQVEAVRVVAFDPDTISALEVGAIWQGFDGPDGLSQAEALDYAVDALRDIRRALDGAEVSTTG